jgi:ketosteroid isomerase-like protein
MGEQMANFLILIFLAMFALQTNAQTRSAGIGATRPSCSFAGTYRINVSDSDKLYSVVKEATSTVPFGDQQRFFMDLSTRLTPPDIVAIECIGPRVSVGSSRAAKLTYLADGRTRREPGASGNFVNSRIEMKNDSLAFISTGSADDNVNVTFQSMDGGDRVRVTRRIYAAQLSEPIVIRTVYDRVAERVDWGDFDESVIARRNRTAKPEGQPARELDRDNENTRGGNESVSDLRTALNDWIDATNRRDIASQMRFYMPVLRAYYLTRNTRQSAVRAEKDRVFSGARSVDIRAAEPEIVFQEGGRTAIMRFIKEYRIAGRSGTKSGSVVQELRWQRSGDEWRIFSERDIRVIR